MNLGVAQRELPPKNGIYRPLRRVALKRFAWWPVILTSGHRIWLERYWLVMREAYETIPGPLEFEGREPW